MVHSQIQALIALLLIVGVALSANSGKIEPNTTGLPTYPHLNSAAMEPAANFQGLRCIVYKTGQSRQPGDS
jgi:hypothetical protein